MGFLAWIVLGLVAGALAKLLMPGRDPGGWIVTILLLPSMGALAMLVTTNPAAAAFVVGSLTGFCLNSASYACVSRSDWRGLAIPVEAEAPERESADSALQGKVV